MVAEQQELSIVAQDTVVVAEPRMERPPHPLADLRHAAMSVPIEQITGLLSDYMGRRTAFRDWLLRQLVEGVHYGVAPGCEPKSNPRPEQWQHKPSLYKAGAEFICDLMNVRAKYTADMAASQQLGESKPDSKGEAKRYFVYKCELFSRQTGELLGEGTGARLLGAKGGDVNNSVKMAQKNALVACVLNVYGLSDLFTQDREQPEYPNPDQAPDAPKAAPRNERVKPEQINELVQMWRSYLSPEGTKEQFAEYCRGVCKSTSYFEKLAGWTQAEVALVKQALEAAGP